MLDEFGVSRVDGVCVCVCECVGGVAGSDV